MLAYLNFPSYIVFGVAFTLVGGLVPGSDLSVASSWMLLVVSIITA